jgi:hypothetical protein
MLIAEPFRILQHYTMATLFVGEKVEGSPSRKPKAAQGVPNDGHAFHAIEEEHIDIREATTKCKTEPPGS